MLCKHIIEKIEYTYPKCAALDWDNVGLLAGRMEKEVSKILVALDATDEIIEQAIAQKVDMLITHHPLIFDPLKQVTDEDFISRRIVKLIQHDVSYYAMHTNYDVLGMADLSAELLGLQNQEILEVTDETKKQGIGRVGFLEQETSLRKCCELVKEVFSIPNIKVFGDLDATVKRVAISPGSGKHMSGLAIEKRADVFITGDIDHHEGIDSVAQGLAIVDAGHYGLEHIFIRDISTFLTLQLDDVEILTEDIKQPFEVL